MANTTPYTHLVGTINIPTATTTEQNIVNQFIDDKEPEFLTDLFGYEFYQLYREGVDINTTIYMDIKNGKTYTNSAGLLCKWEGFTKNRNPIANYIYYHFQKDNASITRSTGENATSVENGTRVTPWPKMKAAWCKMVEWNWNLHDFLVANKSIYPKYIGHTYPPYKGQYRNILPNQNLFIDIPI